MRMSRPRKYELNEYAFSPLHAQNMDYAYWLGFLLADGCVYGRYLELGLASRDVEHLELFRKFLGSIHPLRHKDTTNSVRLTVHSNALVSQLRSFGVVERKSKVATVPHSLSDSPEFWRGMIDGDGYVATKIRTRRYRGRGAVHTVVEPIVSLVGTQAVCTSLQRFCQEAGIHTKANPRKHKHSNAWYFELTGTAARTLHRILYTGTGPRLTRKEQAIA